MNQNHPRARAFLIVGAFVLIVLFVCSGGIILATNASENFLPGDPWFSARQFKDALRVAFARDAATRATMQMATVAYRLNDFAIRAGTQHELVAFATLDDAINIALVALADVPADERAVMLAQLAGAMDVERDVIAQSGLARDAQFLARFDAKIIALRSASAETDLAPERLRRIAVALPALADSSPIVMVAPRIVPPPTGFNHAFPIDGAHAKIECEKCHRKNVYAGTPRDCVACHRDIHKPTLGQQCATCHTTNAWKPVKKK
ncbi:MAG: hypothetical protein HZC40_08730 [Chloroflexi bacterium]|nr:hypothetical protein [Chloroflexota bacterium]